jgi:lipoprotein-anchoring transpeptidase ErfK/SrfK
MWERDVRKYSVVSAVCLTIGAVGLIAATPKAPALPASGPAFDQDILQIQVLLDRAGFSPGVIDGKTGQSLDDAISGYQDAHGLTVTGKLDEPTRAALMRDRTPALGRLKVDARDAAGPFVFPFPKKPEDQAKLEFIGYRNSLEKLAEKFHTTPATIVALNPGGRIGAGAVLVLPNVLPRSRDYEGVKKAEDRQMLSDLNVDAVQPKGDRVVVDKSDRVLRVYAGETLIAQFPATMGSSKDPLPLGTWTINATSYLPPFHYQPDLFWDVADSKSDHRLPPGPNGPVGVVWLDLSKEHYGIHGTGSPETIGRAESHGCIRLTNWDVARLSQMVKPGTKAVFQA